MPVCRRRIYAFGLSERAVSIELRSCANTGADSIKRQTLSLSQASECIILESTGRRTVPPLPVSCAQNALNVLCIRRLMEFACPLLCVGTLLGAARCSCRGRNQIIALNFASQQISVCAMKSGSEQAEDNNQQSNYIKVPPTPSLCAGKCDFQICPLYTHYIFIILTINQQEVYIVK
jgi:hypothetical protein